MTFLVILNLFFLVISQKPEQLHITFGENAVTRVISWVSFDESLPSGSKSVVWYGLDSVDLIYSDYDEFAIFTRNGINRTCHSVQINKLHFLPLNKEIFYKVGLITWDHNILNNITSDIFSFILTNPLELPIHFLVFGDFTTSKANKLVDSTDVALHLIMNESRNTKLDFIFHIGDIGYDLHKKNNKVGDRFMRSIEPVASRIPYLTTAGNHESDVNAKGQPTYETYEYRFKGLTPLAKSSGSPSIHYYSANYGLLHLITFNSDSWVVRREKNAYANSLLREQYEWLLKDLSNVNRSETPWVIALPHRPMYSSKYIWFSRWFSIDGWFEHQYTRGSLGSYPVEELFRDYGVDLYIAGHAHIYERTWPVYDNTVIQKNYVNPKGTVHITTGYPVENDRDEWSQYPSAWSAFRGDVTIHSLSSITVLNRTHLIFRQIRSDDGSTIDEFTISQESHGPFPVYATNKVMWIVVLLGTLCVILLYKRCRVQTITVEKNRNDEDEHFITVEDTLRSGGDDETTKLESYSPLLLQLSPHALKTSSLPFFLRPSSTHSVSSSDVSFLKKWYQ